ncbi:Pol polyprotein [Plakobranchus ocellatus]|uniref:Pol polyprotein n=1 Tax=Plakobranchus ocellatus TaxID=259542 RepID=A0AAV4C0W0_9GAST|nr:Pol polyprotein [Plakobranchus ocellatus]
MGHYQRVCRLKAGTVEEANPEQPFYDNFLEEDDDFVGQIYELLLWILIGQHKSKWTRQPQYRGEKKRIRSEGQPVSPKEFSQLFSGLGCLEKSYSVKLKGEATPHYIYTPREVAHPLLPKVKEELDRMLNEGVISEVKEPTDWCAGMVLIPKTNGSVRKDLH